MRELATGSDRAVAIVGGSIVEMSLTDALKTHLHESKKITDELFRSAGAFGMFATKVHLGLLNSSPPSLPSPNCTPARFWSATTHFSLAGGTSWWS